MKYLFVAIALFSVFTHSMAQNESAKQLAQIRIEECNRFKQDSAIDPIRNKIAALAGSSSIPLSMLADENKPNDVEKKALLEYDAILIKCFQMQNDWEQQYAPPGFAEFMRGMFDKAQADRANLYVGKISYGEYNQNGKARAALIADKWRELANVANANQERAAAARQQEVQTLLSRISEYKPVTLPPIQQPIQTRCTTYGNTMNCTTK